MTERAPAPLPPELEARIAAFESAAPVAGFGKAGWFWMLLLGIVVPILLLAAGWWA
jgi:hypothetical protein